MEGLLAPESRVTSIPDITSSIPSPPSPLVPRALPLAALKEECTLLAASRPSSEISPVPRSMLSQVESTPIDTDSTPLKHPIVAQVHSATCFTRASAIIRKRTSPESKPIIGPGPQPSTNHPSPPSPFLEWTPFIPTTASKVGYVKKRSRKIDFCGGFSDVFRAEIRFRRIRTSELELELKQGVSGIPYYPVKIHLYTSQIGRIEDSSTRWLGREG